MNEEELLLLQSIDLKLEFIISFLLFVFVIFVFYWFGRFLSRYIW